MPSASTHVLAPLIRKLGLHPERDGAEISALERLPYHVRKLERGGYFVREGDKPGHCFVMLAGFIYRGKVTSNGARQILAVHLKGDLVCAHDRLLGEADHNIQALTEARVACISQEAVLALADAFPAIARALWRDNLIDASISREWLLSLGRRNARERLSHLVCELAVRQEAAGLCAAPDYTWPMTQEELGDALGLTSVHVNRTVQGLRRDGMMDVSHRRLSITNMPGLLAEGDFRAGYLHQAAYSQPPADQKIRLVPAVGR